MISVIVPVYNVEKYLRKCIESILDQSYIDWELILINDGSTDNSGVLCDYYAQKDYRIKVVHQNNQGVSTARNVGLEMASGSHILFIDPDDWIEPEMFVNMMDNNNYDMVVCGFNRINISKEQITSKYNVDLWPEKNIEVFVTHDCFYDVLCRTGTLWNKVIRKEILCGLRFRKELRYGEDIVFLTEVLSKIKVVKIIKNAFYNYVANREGNVISAELDSRSLDYLKSAMMVYKLAASEGYSDCGVFRIQITVNDVLNKIPADKLFEYKSYIDACSYALKYPLVRHRLLYYFDCKTPFGSLKYKIRYILYEYFTEMMIKRKYRIESLKA